ncbi:hypothetical protein EMIHUDRAFT_442592 [Emiliania huxleyi CCMP1516]|uniref:Uncharacterized protein n=2 Tax=Emiliania huxleyi TaxID=2903 RepID=A0A0D3K2A4_EMIH1|nr:hypothetical protein EMIHUDRAFT_442592 [Emiliania huxleyi CCMP1516]EOD29889.1 hypothetical protein EMIHUDRAFT_442592 [Emiliania huxleyi CCMP1516]|eukprot:XP_005782318.1 hypothetical protein EMIHUDRAFT_442592 [Emiliania huxleyi CCMP1516]
MGRYLNWVPARYGEIWGDISTGSPRAPSGSAGGHSPRCTAGCALAVGRADAGDGGDCTADHCGCRGRVRAGVARGRPPELAFAAQGGWPDAIRLPLRPRLLGGSARPPLPLCHRRLALRHRPRARLALARLGPATAASGRA